MSGHTPGPLAVKIGKDWPFNINTVDVNGTIVFIDRLPCHSSADKSIKQAMECKHHDKEGRAGYSALNRRALADAVLRAAAPDLLEALQGVLRVADRATDEFDAARAAIAKSIGGVA